MTKVRHTIARGRSHPPSRLAAACRGRACGRVLGAVMTGTLVCTVAHLLLLWPCLRLPAAITAYSPSGDFKTDYLAYCKIWGLTVHPQIVRSWNAIQYEAGTRSNPPRTHSGRQCSVSTSARRSRGCCGAPDERARLEEEAKAEADRLAGIEPEEGSKKKKKKKKKKRRPERDPDAPITDADLFDMKPSSTWSVRGHKLDGNHMIAATLALPHCEKVTTIKCVGRVLLGCWSAVAAPLTGPHLVRVLTGCGMRRLARTKSVCSQRHCRSAPPSKPCTWIGTRCQAERRRQWQPSRRRLVARTKVAKARAKRRRAATVVMVMVMAMVTARHRPQPRLHPRMCTLLRLRVACLAAL